LQIENDPMFMTKQILSSANVSNDANMRETSSVFFY
jgi:hypothetical protein